VVGCDDKAEEAGLTGDAPARSYLARREESARISPSGSSPHKLSTKLSLLLPEQQRRILLPANLSLAVRTESR
jgi:hypothetical protein